MNIIRETFTSIHQMLNVIEGRSNNKEMRDEHSSRDGSKHFTGTTSYEEAKELFQNGYTDVLDKIKNGMAKTDVSRIENRRRVNTGVVGYAPHVPNAILGLPNSMIRTDAQPQKIKAVSIIYSICENCGTAAQEFIDSGVAVLNVINRLELQGVRVNLEIMFWCAKNHGIEYAFGKVKVKDYREHIDIQKLCFPIANPSMFRRFGFKWLETTPDMKESGWAGGYGHTIHSDDKTLQAEIKENEFFMNLEYIKKFSYDADKIIEDIKL